MDSRPRRCGASRAIHRGVEAKVYDNNLELLCHLV